MHAYVRDTSYLMERMWLGMNVIGLYTIQVGENYTIPEREKKNNKAVDV